MQLVDKTEELERIYIKQGLSCKEFSLGVKLSFSMADIVIRLNSKALSNQPVK